MTAHKSQGQTFTHAVMDFESCTSSEAPYFRKISSNPSQDLREEMKRIEMLALKTQVLHGTPSIANEAKEKLANIQKRQPTSVAYDLDLDRRIINKTGGVLLVGKISVIVDAWPEGWPRALDTAAQELPAWRVLPSEYDTLFDYLRVVMQSAKDVTDQTRRNMLAYKPHIRNGLDDPDTVYQVAIHVQGFMQSKRSLKKYGNWKGTIDDAAKASQHLVLESYNFVEPFQAQKRRLSDIKRFILECKGLNTDVDMEVDTDADADVIHLRRRVFTRVSRTNPIVSSVPRDPDDTREEKADRILKGLWVVADGIQYGVRQDNGAVYSSDWNRLRDGDFVDVVVVADIASLRGGRGAPPRLDVHFSMTHIIRLLSVEQLRARGITRPVRESPRRMIMTDTGISFASDPLLVVQPGPSRQDQPISRDKNSAAAHVTPQDQEHHVRKAVENMVLAD